MSTQKRKRNERNNRRKNLLRGIGFAAFMIISVLILSAFSINIGRTVPVSGKNKGEPEHTDTGAFGLRSSFFKGDYPENKLIVVPLLCQYPALPTGCESTAAAMVLQYYGSDMSAEDFAADWLSCSNDFYTVNGRAYGPDPDQAFAGNPFSKYAYGCFAHPIVNAINQNSTDFHAEKLEEMTLSEICETYIAKDMPVLIWATMGMKASAQGKSWYLPDGTEFTWISGEHCLVLVGYSDENYYLNDPQTGSIAAYERSLVERRFAELGGQAVLILP